MTKPGRRVLLERGCGSLLDRLAITRSSRGEIPEMSLRVALWSDSEAKIYNIFKEGVNEKLKKDKI